jgi:cytochrome P450
VRYPVPTKTRQAAKVETFRGSQQPIEIYEEFRRLTLQVIGEAILSLTPEESDRVFPHLYLPIMVRLGARNDAAAQMLRLWRGHNHAR